MKAFSIILVSLFLIACGSSDKPKITGENPDLGGEIVVPEVPVTNERYTSSLSGVVSGINLKDSTVSVYEYSKGLQGTLLGSATLNSEAGYSMSVELTGSKPIVMACVNGGHYKELAGGEQINLSSTDQFCTLSSFSKASFKTINISPWTNIATGLALSKISKGTTLTTAITSSDFEMTQAYGFDIKSTIARSLDSQATTINAASKAALLSAGVSQFTLDLAITNGLSSHTNTYSSLSYFKAAYKDVLNDGLLDGTGVSYYQGPEVSIGIGATTLNGGSYNSSIARGVIKFIDSSNNQTPLNIEDVLSDQEALAKTDNSLFGEEITTINEGGIDSFSPIFTEVNLVNDSVLNGAVNLAVSASDDLMIDSIQFFVDGEVIAIQNSGDFNFLFNTESIADGDSVFAFKAIDLLGNSTSIEFNIEIRNTLAYLSLTSKEIVNNSNYTFTADVINKDLTITAVLINGLSANINGNSVEFDLSLQSGENEIDYKIEAANGYTYENTLMVALDTSYPLLFNTHLNSTYLVNYEHQTNDVVSSSLRFSDTYLPFHIDQFHVGLNNTAPELQSLIDIKQPFIRFYANDINNGHGVWTPIDELQVQYKYYQDGVLKREGVVGGDLLEGMILPIASEYLTNDWAEFTGLHKVEIIITDTAGNSTTTEYPFEVYLAAPKVNSGTGVAASGEGIINLQGDDLEGFEEMRFEVNGVVHSAIASNSLTFDLSSLNLIHGSNFGLIRGYKNGEVVFEQRVDFSIDTTAPIISIDPITYSNTSNLNITGIADDPDSGVASVKINTVDAEYNPFNQNFNYEFTGLSDGIHSYSVEASNTVGLSSTVSGQLNVDTLLPIRDLNYPSDPNYYVNYQTNPTHTPILSTYEFLSGGSSVFYLNQENMYLNGMSPTISHLMDGRFIFISCFYIDRYSAGAETPRGELEVTYSYRIVNASIGIKWVVVDQPLPNDDGTYILPLTHDYLGDDFVTYSTPETYQAIHIKVKDRAGNIDEREYNFQINYDVNSTYPLK